MGLRPLAPSAEAPREVEEKRPDQPEVSCLADIADDEDASIVNRISGARGAMVGMMLGAAFWGAVLTLVVRR